MTPHFWELIVSNAQTTHETHQCSRCGLGAYFDKDRLFDNQLAAAGAEFQDCDMYIVRKVQLL